MKKIFVALLIMLLPIGVSADFLGIKKADEFITMRVITLDSAGIRTKPDSVHVFTYLDGGTALQFNSRSTTYPFDAIGIDTSKIYGDTTYWFVDQIQDIDGTPTPAAYTLTINVVTWGDAGIPTDNWGTVQVLGDSLDVYLSDKTGYTLSAAGYVAAADTTLNRALSDTVTNSIFAKIMRDASAASAQAIANNTDIGKVIDTVNASIDTLQNQDNWVEREASLFDVTADSVIVDFSTGSGIQLRMLLEKLKESGKKVKKVIANDIDTPWAHEQMIFAMIDLRELVREVVIEGIEYNMLTKNLDGSYANQVDAGVIQEGAADLQTNFHALHLYPAGDIEVYANVAGRALKKGGKIIIGTGGLLDQRPDDLIGFDSLFATIRALGSRDIHNGLLELEEQGWPVQAMIDEIVTSLDGNESDWVEIRRA
ncbi:MAG: hypothetical protein IIC66_08955, partial [candidate division Zixibacteria bacterium]|nr:hypothetical protein [candidate division Zixibacteria bacterium]